MDLGRRSPLPRQLDDRGVTVELGRRRHDPRELLDEGSAVGSGKEFQPREGVAQRVLERLGALHRQVAKGPAEGGEGFGSLGVAVGPGEPEIGLVPPAEQDVALLHVGRHLLGATQEVGEGPLGDAHGASISELLQM